MIHEEIPLLFLEQRRAVEPCALVAGAAHLARFALGFDVYAAHQRVRRATIVRAHGSGARRRGKRCFVRHLA